MNTSKFEIQYTRADFLKELKELNLRNLPMVNFVPDISIAEAVAIECFIQDVPAPVCKSIIQNFRKYGQIFWKTSFYE